MLPSPRSCTHDGFLVVWFGFLVLLLPASGYGQVPSATSASSGQKPLTRQITVITNENIGFSLVSHAAKPSSPASEQPAPAVEKTSGVSPEEAEKRTAEIAALRKQIKDKQKRIELLMHLFVADERKFVQFPTDLAADPDVELRVRAEQEELRAESAACARLQTRLDALLAANDSPR